MRAPADSVVAASVVPVQTVGAVKSPPRASALRTYVVEDNRVVRENLIAALEELAPLQVVGSAADERVALDWLRNDVQACDLMIIDLFLHSGSGLGVLAAARAERPHTALVILSNFATQEIRARCLAGGADRVFDKSRDIDLLIGYCTTLAARGGSSSAH